MTLNSQLVLFRSVKRKKAVPLIGSFISMWTTLSIIGLGGVSLVDCCFLMGWCREEREKQGKELELQMCGGRAVRR